MSKQWIMIADRSRARIFESDRNFDELREIEDLLNPQGRQNDAELHHDAKGRYYGRGKPHQGDTAESPVSQREHHEEAFSRRLMQLLAEGCDKQRYNSLVMVAPPEFLGFLRKHVPKRVEQHITGQLRNNLSSLPIREIGTYLKKHLQIA